MEIREIYEFIKDFWQMIKGTYETKADDRYWSDLLAKSAELFEKYKRNDLVKCLLTAYVGYLDDMQMEKEHANQTL